MAYDDDDPPDDGEFAQLIKDSALGREVREQFEREQLRATALSFDADTERADRELLEQVSLLKARTAKWAAEAPKRRVQTYAERRAAHVELVRRGKCWRRRWHCSRPANAPRWTFAVFRLRRSGWPNGSDCDGAEARAATNLRAAATPA